MVVLTSFNTVPRRYGGGRGTEMNGCHRVDWAEKSTPPLQQRIK